MHNLYPALLWAAIAALWALPASAQSHFTNCAARTGTSATVIVPAESAPKVNDQPLKAGSEIALFSASGLCVGVAVWEGSATGITVWGDDAVTSETDGMKQGEPLRFRVWDGGEVYAGKAVKVAYKEQPFFGTKGLYERDKLFLLASLRVDPPVSSGDNPVTEAPSSPSSSEEGLSYAYYEGTWKSLPDFSSETPVKTGTASRITPSMRKRNDKFGLRFTGYVKVPSDGKYTFYTRSDDGSRLWIGGKQVVDNDGQHAPRERSGKVKLSAGWHAIRAAFFERAGGEVMEVYWKGPGLAKEQIPSKYLATAQPSSEDRENSGKRIQLDLRVMLRGPYSWKKHSMSTTLNDRGYLPQRQPYAQSRFKGTPLYFNGDKKKRSKRFFRKHRNVVDYVLLELRSGRKAKSVVKRRAALLLKNGKVVDLDGKSRVTFDGVKEGKYYVVVRHRNHLSVMSRKAVRFKNGRGRYDFTKGRKQAYGKRAMVPLGKSGYAMKVGDGNLSGSVTASDMFKVWFPQRGNKGYRQGDYNLSGRVAGDDRIVFWSPNGTSSHVPER